LFVPTADLRRSFDFADSQMGLGADYRDVAKNRITDSPTLTSVIAAQVYGECTTKQQTFSFDGLVDVRHQRRYHSNA
jgi:hypothetical protein